MNTKNILIGGAILALVGLAFVQANKQIQVTVQPQQSANVAAVSGPDTYFPYVANNDLQKFGSRAGFAQATTTVCAIISPAATSTLVFGSAKFASLSTSAALVTMAKAATPYATTTLLNIASIAAGLQGTVLATTTWAGGLDPATVFAPNTYLVVGVQGAGTPFSPVGSCEAEFVRN